MEIIVARYGSAEWDRIDRITDNPQNWIDGKIPAFINVGKFESQHVNGGHALGSQEYGVWVRGYSQKTGWIELPPVRGKTVYEPKTINKMGQPGAYRDLPPTEDQIKSRVDEIRAMMIDRTEA